MKRLVAILALLLAVPLSAEIVNSGLQDITIPNDFAGVYLDIDTGLTNTAEFAGWDINVFFGGVGIGGSPDFQPCRVGVESTDTILCLNSGDVVDGSRLYATGYNGSQDHLGAPGNFQDGQKGFLGFSFMKNGGTGPYYGWMSLTLTANTPGGVIHEWAWENTGAAITVPTAVPEPGSALLIACAGGLLLKRKRR
jgi:hypothetical protein